MPRRKELKGVAAALAGRFISRNNDANGYWALGMLYKAANKVGVNNLSLDIIAGESSLYFKHASRLSLPLHELLLKQLESRGFEEYQVRAAVVELEFNVSPTARQVMYRSTWGEAFTCRVVLTDDLNKQHSFEERGWCGIHDPGKEHQSTREYAL